MNSTKANPLMMRLRPLCLSLLLVVATAASAAPAQTQQTARLQISNLDQLASRAAEVVDVNIDERLLRLASRFLSSNDADEVRVREIVAGLRGVYVRSFEFARENEYSQADVEAIRAQLRSPAWMRIVEVRSRRANENVEVYLMTEGERVNGLALISAGPKELTVVNIVCAIDLERLSALEGSFGIPRLGIERTNERAPQQEPQREQQQRGRP